MSLDFMRVGSAEAVARSPMLAEAQAAGATLESRDGWLVAQAFPNQPAAGDGLVWADTSAVHKFEVNGSAAQLAPVAAALGLEQGASRAERIDSAWCCWWHPGRLLVVGDSTAPSPTVAASVDVSDALVFDATASFVSVTIAGDGAADVLARFCSLDLRAGNSQPGSFHPASVARVPGAVLHEAAGRLRILTGWAHGEYLWTVIAEAAGQLGGVPVSADSLPALGAGGDHA